MKYILACAIVLMAIVGACHKPTEGYLIVENAGYEPDTMVIRKNPVWELDSFRIMDNSPWVTTGLQGYEGTEPIYFSVESVTSPLGEEAAAVFMREVFMQGASLMYPLKNNAQPGLYTVSIRLTNAGYSQVVENALTFHVIE